MQTQITLLPLNCFLCKRRGAPHASLKRKDIDEHMYYATINGFSFSS